MKNQFSLRTWHKQSRKYQYTFQFEDKLLFSIQEKKDNCMDKLRTNFCMTIQIRKRTKKTIPKKIFKFLNSLKTTQLKNHCHFSIAFSSLSSCKNLLFEYTTVIRMKYVCIITLASRLFVRSSLNMFLQNPRYWGHEVL